MAAFGTLPRFLPLLASALVLLLTLPAQGQINSPCSASMISSFSPCMNFITNSTANGTAPTPTTDCCNSLRSVTSNGTDCLCLILTGSVPFRIPINRTLAISLPRACNMPGVPLQCKASVAPIPAPGPVSPGLALSPGAAPSSSPLGSSIPQSNVSPSLAPESSTNAAPTPLSPTAESVSPTSPTVGSEAPTTTTGSRPDLNPTASATPPSSRIVPSLVLLALGLTVLKYC